MRFRTIDFRLLGIAGVILAVALGTAFGTIELFRELFPVVAKQTFWDEITGPTIAALVILGIKWLLYREKVFHLLLIMDVPATETAQLYVLRRQRGIGLVFMPTLCREAMVRAPDTMIRNVFWWGCTGYNFRVRSMMRLKRP